MEQGMTTRISVLCYNEAKMIPMFHKWYRKRLPSAQFMVYDNYSTDGSPDIAKQLGMVVTQYDTNNKLSDVHLREIKNNAFKQHMGWNIVVDMDEWLDVTEQDLVNEYYRGVTVLTTNGYHMVNVDGHKDYTHVNKGVYDRNYDKLVCMNSALIKDMNYIMGAHIARPEGLVLYSERQYTLRHMKYMNANDMIERYKVYTARHSDHNKFNNYGIHHNEHIDKIHAQFSIANELAKLVP
jgi:hypothetical protein